MSFMLAPTKLRYKNSISKYIPKTDDKNKSDLAICILTMNQPINLEKILRSYSLSGFLDYCDEKIILLQTNNREERKIAEKYKLKIYYTNKNIGIGPANNMLIDRIKAKYFVILQNDFVLVNNNFKKEIENAKFLIKNNIANCYRLRYRLDPGDPCCCARRLDIEETHMSGLLYYNFYKNHETKDKWDSVKNRFLYNNDMDVFILSSKNANYTENPCLYDRLWYINSLYNYNKNPGITGRQSEISCQKVWENNDFKVAMGVGLFKHDDSKQ